MLHILAYNTNINNGQMSSDEEKKGINRSAIFAKKHLDVSFHIGYSANKCIK